MYTVYSAHSKRQEGDKTYKNNCIGITISALNTVDVSLNLEKPYCTVLCDTVTMEWIAINAVNNVLLPNEEQTEILKGMHFYKEIDLGF